jgi:hypothetical protein
MRAIARDDISGMRSQNPFTVLNNAPDTILHDIMPYLDIEVENVEVQLNVFKQEEIARAAVAEVNYKKYLEAQKAKNSHDNENELTDLTMEVISNQHRDCLELFPMDGGA